MRCSRAQSHVAGNGGGCFDHRGPAQFPFPRNLLASVFECSSSLDVSVRVLPGILTLIYLFG